MNVIQPQWAASSPAWAFREGFSSDRDGAQRTVLCVSHPGRWGGGKTTMMRPRPFLVGYSGVRAGAGGSGRLSLHPWLNWGPVLICCWSAEGSQCTCVQGSLSV